MRTGLGEGSVTGTGISCGADCNETFTSVTSVTLTATVTPGTASTFVGWGGDCSGATVTCTVSVSAISSVRAEFGLATPVPPLTDFTPVGIETYLSANPSVDTPARFLAALPVDFRQNWILMVRSESLQTGTATSPRILLPSADSQRVFTIGMTQHSSYPGAHPNAIEYMQWDAGQRNFRFHEIVLDAIPALGDEVDPGPPPVLRFPARSRGVSIDDPKCFACHSTRNVLNRGTTPATDGIPPGSVGHKTKPNWDTYDSWAGMLSFNRDRIYKGSVEAAAFRRIFNLWTWQTNDTVRSIIERLELQPPGVPAGHVITRNSGGGANDGHISFPFDGGAIVSQEPAPVGASGADGSASYEFDGAAGSGGASTFARDGDFITLHHSLLPGCFGGGCSPASDEGRAVDLFDELFGVLNPERVADEVVNHRFVTGSIAFDVKPLALAVAQRCIAVAGGANVAATQSITSTPALSATALSALAFFNQRHGVSSFDQVYDDTRLRQAYFPLRKADIQRITLDRTIDPYAYDANPTMSPPPPAIVDGLVQAYGADTELFDSGAPLSAAEMLERIRAEVFRRRPSASQEDSTLMGGVYVDREVPGTAPQMALYRYFLEPLGVSVDKWSIAVRGRSRTYTMADVFMGRYDNALAGPLKSALGLAGLGMTDTCNQVIPMVETSLAALPPATGPDAMPKYTDIQRIFNKSCIECHGGLGYPPYHTYGTYLDLSEDENPPPGDRRMTRSWTIASSLAGTSATSSFLLSRITDRGRLAHPYDPDEPYNRANPDDPADPDVLDERCPYGLMPCGGPPLSRVDIETISRWVEGGASYSEGDPHIRTVDGVNYDLQTAGEFVLLRDEGLELQARHTPVTTAGPLGPNPYTGLSTCVSVNTAVAFRSGGQRISYQPGSRAPIDPDRRTTRTGGGQLVLRIDGVPTQLGPQPILLSSGGRIRRTSADGGIQIEHPGGTVIVITPAFWSHHQIWYMNIDVRRTRATAGIMGPIAPGNWLPALPDGTQLGPMPTGLRERYDQLYRTFADAWRVADTTSLFDYAPGLSAASYAVPSWPEFAPNNCTAPQVPDGSLAGPPVPLDRAQAERLCSAIVDPDREANCLADVAATGEAGFAEAYLVTERLERNESPSEPVLNLPADFSENLALPVNFTWMRAIDAERDRVTYRHCVWSADTVFDFNKCSVVAEPFASRDSLVYGGIALLIALLLLFILFRTLLRNRPIALALVAVLLLLAVVMAFYSGRREALDEMVADLESGSTYFWKVIAEDEEGAIAESATRRLTVQ